MGVLFYPRGGSAQVVRYLSAALEKEDWHVSLLCGSLGRPGERTHAETFYAGMDLTAVDYNPAFEAFEHGRDPIAEPVPFHPSFEHEPGARVPDRVFAAVSPALGDHLTSFWEGAMAEAWPGDPTVIHLHHVTPLNEAAIRRWPDRPLVTHLHGTDLGMLARIRGLSDEQKNLPDWQYADHWAKRLRAAAHRSDRLIVISPHQREVAHDVLGLDLERIEWIPNGVDIERFGRGSPPRSSASRAGAGGWSTTLTGGTSRASLGRSATPSGTSITSPTRQPESPCPSCCSWAASLR
jgi:glycosyltransferase involved in cell wall biosynthesis